MRRRTPLPASRPRRLFPLLSVALMLAFLTPYGIGLASEARAATPSVTPELVNNATGSLTWNGVNVNTAPTPSSAIGWTFNTVATVQYVFVGPLTGVGVSQAYLVILFLGFPTYTKQVVEQTAFGSAGGSITMTYDLTQFKWYLQGLYELHAYLENPNGTTLWSEYFYVRVAQPYDIVVSTVGLLLLTIAELYMIATVGPRSMDKLLKTQAKQAEAPPAEEGTSGEVNPPPGGGA